MRSDSVGEHQPSFRGLDRRSAVADLDELPWLLGVWMVTGRSQQPGVVGRGQPRCVSRSHRDSATKRPPMGRGKEPYLCWWRLRRRAVTPEGREVLGLQQLRGDTGRRRSGIGGVVGGPAVVVGECARSGRPPCPWLSLGPCGNRTRSSMPSPGEDHDVVGRHRSTAWRSMVSWVSRRASIWGWRDPDGDLELRHR